MTYLLPTITKHRDMETRNPRNRGIPDAGFSLLRGFLFYHLQVRTLHLPLRLQTGIQITDNLLLVHVLTDEHDFLHTVAILLIPVAHHAGILT